MSFTNISLQSVASLLIILANLQFCLFRPQFHCNFYFNSVKCWNHLYCIGLSFPFLKTNILCYKSSMYSQWKIWKTHNYHSRILYDPPPRILVLFLGCSREAYWTPTDLGGSSFSGISFCLCKMLFLFVSYTSMKLKNGTNILNYYKYIFKSIRSLYSRGHEVSWPAISVWGFQWVNVSKMHTYGDYLNFVLLI